MAVQRKIAATVAPHASLLVMTLPPVDFGEEYSSRMTVWQTKPCRESHCAAATKSTHGQIDARRVPVISVRQDLIENSAVADLSHRRRAGRAGGIRDPRAIAAVAHLDIETIALLLEARHHRPLERTAARQLDAQRVDEATIDQNFVVDVRSGRLAGRSDKADHLALTYPLAGFHALGEGRHVIGFVGSTGQSTGPH